MLYDGVQCSEKVKQCLNPTLNVLQSSALEYALLIFANCQYVMVLCTSDKCHKCSTCNLIQGIVGRQLHLWLFLCFLLVIRDTSGAYGQPNLGRVRVWQGKEQIVGSSLTCLVTGDMHNKTQPDTSFNNFELCWQLPWGPCHNWVTNRDNIMIELGFCTKNCHSLMDPNKLLVTTCLWSLVLDVGTWCNCVIVSLTNN